MTLQGPIGVSFSRSERAVGIRGRAFRPVWKNPHGLPTVIELQRARSAISGPPIANGLVATQRRELALQHRGSGVRAGCYPVALHNRCSSDPRPPSGCCCLRFFDHGHQARTGRDRLQGFYYHFLEMSNGACGEVQISTIGARSCWQGCWRRSLRFVTPRPNANPRNSGCALPPRRLQWAAVRRALRRPRLADSNDRGGHHHPWHSRADSVIAIGLRRNALMHLLAQINHLCAAGVIALGGRRAAALESTICMPARCSFINSSQLDRLSPWMQDQVTRSQGIDYSRTPAARSRCNSVMPSTIQWISWIRAMALGSQCGDGRDVDEDIDGVERSFLMYEARGVPIATTERLRPAPSRLRSPSHRAGRRHALATGGDFPGLRSQYGLHCINPTSATGSARAIMLGSGTDRPDDRNYRSGLGGAHAALAALARLRQAGFAADGSSTSPLGMSLRWKDIGGESDTPSPAKPELVHRPYHATATMRAANHSYSDPAVRSADSSRSQATDNPCACEPRRRPRLDGRRGRALLARSSAAARWAGSWPDSSAQPDRRRAVQNRYGFRRLLQLSANGAYANTQLLIVDLASKPSKLDFRRPPPCRSPFDGVHGAVHAADPGPDKPC